jgi:hypothetical protein
MSYTNLNNPANYQLQSFGQNGVRTISTDQLYIQGEYYRVLVAEEDSYVTAVSVLGDDLTAEFVYAGTTIYGLFTEVSVTSGSLTAYIAGPTDIEDVWAYINAYGEANAATIEAADCAKDAIAPLLDKYYAKASLVMVPSLYKTSIVYSERPLTTAGQLAFTRSNDTATRVGSDGLIEKVRTNLLLQSNTFNTTWVVLNSPTLTANYAANPIDGANDAWRFQAANDNDRIYQTFSGSFLNFSIYAKGTGTLRLRDNVGVYTDVTLTASWQRVSVHFSSSISNVQITSGTSCDAVIYAAQLEAGDIATDYIPTTTTAVSVGPVANLPRLNYPINSVGCPSLLLEPQRTNEIPYSEYLLGWPNFTNVAITQNQTTSPQGITNGVLMARSGSGDLGGSVRYTGISTTANSKCYSVFAKANAHNFIQLYHSGDAQGYVNFNLLTGAVGTSGSKSSGTIESYGSGWYRCTAIYDSTNTFGSSYYIGFAESASAPYAGGAVPDTSSVYLYGVQLESSASYATSYIPTYGAAVTRGADACIKTGISSLIGQTEGTLFVEVAALSGANDVRQISISDGTTSNRVTMALLSNGTQIQFVVQSGGSVVMDSTQTIAGLTSGVKIAYAYKVNDFAVYVNGSLLATDTNGAVPISMSAFSFDAGNSGDKFFGKIAQALLFKTRLTNQELQDLTTL